MANHSTASTLRPALAWRFRLRSLLIVIGLCSVFLAWWHDHQNQARRLELQSIRLQS